MNFFLKAILLKKQHIYIFSFKILLKVIYSASVIEIHMICYLLLDQKTKTFFIKKWYSIINW